MTSPIIYMMIGPAGSGKSTIAKAIQEIEGGVIISSDAVRAELYGDEAVQGKIFNIFYHKANCALEEGKNVILDATNLTRKDRAMAFLRLRACSKSFIAVHVNVSEETALKRNSKRDRQVPEHVIRRMYKRYQEPSFDEGFIEIIEVDNE